MKKATLDIMNQVIDYFGKTEDGTNIISFDRTEDDIFEAEIHAINILMEIDNFKYEGPELFSYFQIIEDEFIGTEVGCCFEKKSFDYSKLSLIKEYISKLEARDVYLDVEEYEEEIVISFSEGMGFEADDSSYEDVVRLNEDQDCLDKFIALTIFLPCRKFMSYLESISEIYNGNRTVEEELRNFDSVEDILSEDEE